MKHQYTNSASKEFVAKQVSRIDKRIWEDQYYQRICLYETHEIIVLAKSHGYG